MMVKRQAWADRKHSRVCLTADPGGRGGSDWHTHTHTHTHTGNECADQWSGASAFPLSAGLRLSTTELDCIIHERPPLKEHLSSQPLKTNETHTHTHAHTHTLLVLLLVLHFSICPQPHFAYQSEASQHSCSLLVTSRVSFTSNPNLQHAHTHTDTHTHTHTHTHTDTHTHTHTHAHTHNFWLLLPPHPSGLSIDSPININNLNP